MNVANTIKKLGLEQAFDYLYKDPENNLLKLMCSLPPDGKSSAASPANLSVSYQNPAEKAIRSVWRRKPAQGELLSYK